MRLGERFCWSGVSLTQTLGSEEPGLCCSHNQARGLSVHWGSLWWIGAPGSFCGPPPPQGRRAFRSQA